jgi:hypothetical protein
VRKDDGEWDVGQLNPVEKLKRVLIHVEESEEVLM